MYRFKTKKQDLGELFLDGLNLFGYGFKHIWPWAVLSAILGILTPHLVIKSLEMTGGKVHVHVRWAVLVLMLLLSFPGVFFGAVMLRRLFLMGADKVETVKKTLTLVAKRFFPLYTAMFTISVISVFGFMFMFIPGLFFMVVFIFVYPLIVLDDYGIIGAFKQSWHLVWGNWWRIFAMLVFPFLVIGMVGLMPHSDKPILTHLSHAAVMCFATPLLLSFILTIFYDAKLRHHVAMHLPKKKKKAAVKKKSAGKKKKT